MKKFWTVSAVILFALTTATAQAEEKEIGFWKKIQSDISETWHNPTPSYDLYVPINAWHNRLTYDKDKIEEYNEEPWGLGLGMSRYDEDGDWHGLYAMAFKDSNFYLQTIAGYAYMKNWYIGCNRDFAVGLGYTLSLTQRHEYNYIPVPLPLPLAGITYKNVSLQAAYVPGLKNDGNVLFTWLRFTY